MGFFSGIAEADMAGLCVFVQKADQGYLGASSLRGVYRMDGEVC